MITRAIIGSLLMMIMFLGTYGFSEHLKVKDLSIQISNRDQAIKAYEELLKVVPFNALSSDRKERADADIQEVINNSNSITDSTYRL